MARDGLAGLRVVQVGGGVAAGYATRMLADLGSEVVRLEDPSGDRLRRLGPGSALFEYLAAGTGSKLADVATDGGRESLEELVGRQDGTNGPVLVVDALGPGGLEQAGVDPDDMAAWHGPVAVVRIAPYGQEGPSASRPTTELTLQAAGGWVSDHGMPGMDPVRVGGRLASWVVGTYAAVAGLTAVRSAWQREEFVVADLSAQECLMGTLPYPMLLRRTLRAIGAPTSGRRYVVPGIIPCRDGWVGVNALTGQHWQDICVLFETPAFDGRQQELLGDDGAYRDFLAAAAPWLSDRDGRDIVDLCQAFRIPAAPVGDGRSLPELEHFAARSVYRPAGEGLRFPRPPQRFGDDDAVAPPVAPAPAVGAVAPDGASSTRPWPTWSDDVPDRPFDGLRVVDLSIFWAGPYVTMYLASMGADVVKIESTIRPDGFRFAGAFPQLGDDWYERSLVWQATNLGKRSLTLDLGSDQGMDLLWGMIDEADVLIENFAPRVAEGFGLTADAVAARRPELVYLRMPGFGLDGPWRDHVGWAMSYEQASGAAAVTGFADRAPVNPGGFADPVVGMHATAALHAAIVERERTGLGGMIEIPQIEVLAAITAEQVAVADLTGQAPRRSGNQSDEAAVEAVQQAVDDGWVAWSVRDVVDWDALVDGLGPLLADLTWDSVLIDPHATVARLAEWTGQRSARDSAATLQGLGLPAVVLLDVDDMADDPQLRHRRWYEELDHPRTGPAPYPGWPFRLRPGPERFHDRPAPTLGQHNDDVLAEMGVDADTRARLRGAGVIGEGMAAGPA